MIKNFQEFLNENQKIDPMTCNFNRNIDYTEISDRENFPPVMIKEIADKLEEMRLTDNGKNLDISFDKDEPMILMTANDTTWFYGWNGDYWTGGYEELVKLSDGGTTYGGSQNSMSPEEFMGCLHNMDIIDTQQDLEEILKFIAELRKKYHGAISGSEYKI